MNFMIYYNVPNIAIKISQTLHFLLKLINLLLLQRAVPRA